MTQQNTQYRIEKNLTPEQLQVQTEYMNLHDLDASQISFENSDATPILDYEAVCALSLKLTNIQTIECEISERDYDAQVVTARCTVTLPDGRTRISEDSANVNESFADGRKIVTIRLAEAVAQARAVRRGIRSVGINLHRAHEQYKKTGNAAAAHTNNDPRQPLYQEVHVLATKLGFIQGGNKSAYQNYIAEQYDGRTSSKDLNDIELQKLLISFRAFDRLQKSTNAAADQEAA